MVEQDVTKNKIRGPTPLTSNVLVKSPRSILENHFRINS